MTCYYTAMPPKPPQTDLFDPSLLSSFETVVRFTYENASSKGASLAVMQLLYGVTQSQWEIFAASHNIGQWLSVPLTGSESEAVAAMVEALERLAFQRDHDPLTGIGNRRLFDRVLSSEVDRARRSHAEVSLLMLDLDNFKQINDTYGHPCGDVVLQRLGEVLRTSVRPYDTVARIGGEEFGVILPSTPSWTAVVLAKRILARFSAEEFTHDETNFRVTFSGGVASLGLLSGEPTPDRIVKSADAALYAAKAQGKNRIVVMESDNTKKDRGTLVRSHEKQFLFSNQGLEQP